MAITNEFGNTVQVFDNDGAGVFAFAPFTFRLEVLDAYGNIATGFRGVVRFRSTDPAATFLPPSYRFTADAGRHTFRAGYRSRGARTLAAVELSRGVAAAVVVRVY